jgi:UrcA family protein
MRIPVAALLIASPFAFAFVGSSNALAQNCNSGTYAGYDPTPAPPENVIVTAPRLERPRNSYPTNPINTTPSAVTASQSVPYADLNLCTDQGAAALRDRVSFAAHSVCDQLAVAYPHALDFGRTCVRDSLANAQPRVDFVIQNARGER